MVRLPAHAAPLKTLAVFFALAPLVRASPAAAQDGLGARPTRAVVGGRLSIAQPVGEFKNYVNNGFGGGRHLLLRVDPRGFLALRLDGGYLVYGHERKRVSLPGAGRVQLDVTTSNNIVTYSVGPQLMVPTGPVRPYVNAFAGGAYLFTESSIGDADYDGDFASTRNFGDNVPSYGYGGGVFIPLAVRNTLVGIDLGARFMRNGFTRYLREGGVTDLPDGGVEMAVTVAPRSCSHWIVGSEARMRRSSVIVQAPSAEALSGTLKSARRRTRRPSRSGRSSRTGTVTSTRCRPLRPLRPGR